MKKAIWIISGLLTLIISLVYFYFKGSLHLDTKSDLFAYLSDKNAIVLDFKFESDLSEILKEDQNFPSLFYDDFISEIAQFNSLILNNKSLQASILSKDIMVAAQKVNAKSLGCIYFTSLSDIEIDDPSVIFNSDAEPIVKSKSRAFENELIYHYEKANHNFYYYYKTPYLIVSKYPTLVEDAIRAKLRGKNLSQIPIFQKWQNEQTTSKSILSLFLNHAKLSEFYSLFFNLPFQKSLGFSDNFASYSYTELNYKSDAWILNGELESAEENYFSLLKNQTENRSYLCDYLSSNVWAFQNIILSDQVQFRTDLQKQVLQKKDFYFDAEVKLMKRKYGLNVNALIKEHLGSELISAYYPNYSLLKHNGYIAMLVLVQPEEFAQKIDRLQRNKNSTVYKNYTISSFPIRKMMFLCAGEPFKELESKYYLIIEDRLMMSSDLNDMKRYIDDYSSEQLLNKKESFQNYMSRMNDQYNYLFYCGISGYESSIKSILNTKSNAKLISRNGWSNYSAFSYQVTSSDAGLINSIYLPLKENTNTTSIEQKWQVNLESGIGNVAQWVTNITKDKNYIIAQDDTNQLYLFDEESNLIWKKQIPGEIISEIHAVDYYKNGTTQLLFNTKNHIYLIDLLGATMPNYPIKLSSEASLGMSMFDYDNNKSYRIFIAAKNQCIYGYDLSGRPLEGWSPKRVGEIIDKIQHIRVSNKDFIFVPTVQGYFYFFNRKAELQSQFRDSVNIRYHNPFYFDLSADYGKNRFVSTDQYGKIKSIYVDGRRLFKSVGTWTETHSFLYANVFGDNRKDYVFVDNNQLMVFQDDTTVGFNYQFNTTINDKAFAIKLENENSLLGVMSKETEQVYLFDREGKLLNGFPVNAKLIPSFIIVNNQRKMIIANSDGKLTYYIL